MPTMGSLFAGIGGLDLGLERAGWTVRWQVEHDPFCQRVLAQHWPHVARHGDIRTLDPARLERVDLVCGGFPCQSVSRAGKQLGTADERWLWPEYARIVRVLRPRLLLVENVPGLLGRGLGDVLGDLAASGYDAEWDCIPAVAVGAPHLRDRVWIVGHRRDGGAAGAGALADAEAHGCGSRGAGRSDSGRAGERELPLQALADAEEFALGTGFRPREPGGERGRRSGDGGGAHDAASADGALPQRNGLEGFLQARSAARDPFGAIQWWAAEPDVGRVAHGVPQRVDRLRALGNAVVPQIAEWIGRRLLEAERIAG